MKFDTRDELASALGLALKPPVIVVTYHPTSLGTASPEDEVAALVTALKQVDGTLVISCPNADPGNQVIARGLRELAGSRQAAELFTNLGQHRYYSLLALADCMVGNSSSGIWEAPSFHLPVVNIGDRQKGRRRAGNILDVPVESGAILQGIQQALSVTFRESFASLTNLYGDGVSASRIVDALKGAATGPRLLQKRFIDAKRPD
ncbi:MAG TPA: UDP-N-acetylglucosamine 2-epimerase, partial [Blastocatellia bacterium]